MKPTFALDLSRDIIALLHRTPKGWLTVGEVAFDAADIAEELDYLRKTALGLSPLGLACKVILPNSQILYTEIHAPGPSREDKRRQIAQALQGRTPYAVEDLVFDWSGKGAVVRVAVVARETLDEAEAFAVAHRLNPVSFVAIPEDGTFVGEAWFGPTSAADTFLAPGETVERDREAVTIIPLDLSGTRQGPGNTPGERALEEIDSLPGLEDALSAEVSEADLAAISASRSNGPAAEPFDSGEALFDDPSDGPDLAQIEPPIPPASPLETSSPSQSPVAESLGEVLPKPGSGPAIETGAALPAEPVEAGQSIADAVAEAAVATPPDTVASDDKSSATPQADPDEAPFADVAEEPEAPPPPDAKPQAAGGAQVLAPDILDDDLPPAPSAAAMLAFSSRRAAPGAAASDRPGRISPPVTAASGRPASSGAASSAAARPFSAAVTAPSIPGTRPSLKPKPAIGDIPRPIPPGPVTVKSPARSSGTFGPAVPKRGRSGFTFMILVGLLLLSLALVAAWASFFLTQAASDAGDEPAAVDQTEVIEVPAIEDEMAADLQDPEDFALIDEGTEVLVPTEDEAADLAALAVEEMPVNMGGDSSGQPPTESVAATLDETALPGDPAAGTEATVAGAEDGSTEPAPGNTVTTEVSGARTPVEDQDEIFLAAMDAPPPILDAHALPTPSATTDALPDSPMPPPAPGTVYQFDAQGLLVPTPEGILSPDGIMLYAGPPPLIPPARSPAATAAAAEVAALAPSAATDSQTAADASLVTGDVSSTETAEEAPVELAPSDPAMAGFRPRPRPEGLAGPDDGASLDTEPATETTSLRPLPRPASVAAAADAVAPDTAGSTVADLGAQGASLAAQAAAKLAEAEALEAANPSIVAISMRPAARPDDLSRAVEAAVAAAVREPDPAVEADVELAAATEASSEEHAEIDEPETEGAAPSIPTKASVAKQATYSNAINLSKVNLIGTFGTSSKPYALVRLANGKYKKVKVGDKIDGGVVKAITENEVRYQKGGKLVSLKMPKA